VGGPVSGKGTQGEFSAPHPLSYSLVHIHLHSQPLPSRRPTHEERCAPEPRSCRLVNVHSHSQPLPSSRLTHEESCAPEPCYKLVYIDSHSQPPTLQ